MFQLAFEVLTVFCMHILIHTTPYEGLIHHDGHNFPVGPSSRHFHHASNMQDWSTLQLPSQSTLLISRYNSLSSFVTLMLRYQPSHEAFCSRYLRAGSVIPSGGPPPAPVNAQAVVSPSAEIATHYA